MAVISSSLGCIWNNLDLSIVLIGHSQETPGIAILINQARLVFSIIWHKEISKIYWDEGRLRKYYVISQSKFCGLVLMAYKLFDEKVWDTSTDTGREKSDENKKLFNELHRPITRKFQRRKVYSSYHDNIWGTDIANVQPLNNWGTDLVNVQPLRKYNNRSRFLICVIDVYSKYALVIPLKDKNGITITNAFKKFLDESICKRKKICLDQSSELFKALL